jgi:hypothetical protein
MALTSDKNLYPGINAHLNSFLQNTDGAWRSFHAEHIVDLARTIKVALPSGYLVVSEQSLQIGEFDTVEQLSRRAQTVPDVTVYQHSAGQSGVGAAEIEAAPTAVLELAETLDDEQFLTGMVIYQAGEGSPLGKPITRIELLSPSNKPGGTHYEQYLVKKLLTLKSGLRLVEIDYLHETPPIIPVLPKYSKQEAGAYPYTIIVSDPRPTLEQGKALIYGIGVDQTLPVVGVPLAGQDVVKVDFGASYGVTFENSPFALLSVDYKQEPLNFERYREADRELIRQRLADIRTQHSG